MCVIVFRLLLTLQYLRMCKYLTYFCVRAETLGNRRWSQLADERTRKYGDKSITIILTTVTHKSPLNHHDMIKRSSRATVHFAQRSKKKEKSCRHQMLHARIIREKSYRRHSSVIQGEREILQTLHIA
jgi:hypothetical protein